MSTYEPGTVALVTAWNAKTPYRAAFDGQTWRALNDSHLCVNSPATIRPLVVLDLALNDVTPERMAEFIVKLYRSHKHPWTEHVADQIEAQTKPPRIPEPGLWGVVEAGPGERGRWIKTPHRWLHDSGMRSSDWDDLIDPTLIRDGIEGAS